MKIVIPGDPSVGTVESEAVGASKGDAKAKAAEKLITHDFIREAMASRWPEYYGSRKPAASKTALCNLPKMPPPPPFPPLDSCTSSAIKSARLTCEADRRSDIVSDRVDDQGVVGAMSGLQLACTKDPVQQLTCHLKHMEREFKRSNPTQNCEGLFEEKWTTRGLGTTVAAEVRHV